MSIEVKCPKSFYWPAPVPAKKDLEWKLKEEIKGARDQIAGGKAGGLVVIGAGQFSSTFAADLEESLKDVVQNQRISTKIAAVSAVCFFGPKIEGWHGSGPKLTSGCHVYIALNPRFPEPNPIQTDRDSSA
jgi:hypothetical protein